MADEGDRVSAELQELMEAASTRFQHGDSAGMAEFYADDENITLFGALGGCARGREKVERILDGAAANLSRGGNARYDIVSMVVDGTMAYCTGMERIDQGAEGLSDLRVTNVFRQQDGVWRLMHRHADVLRESPFA